MSTKSLARADYRQQEVDRLDTTCSALGIVQKRLTERARPQLHTKIVVECDVHDGFVDTVRVTETHIHKIPRHKAAA